jgi:hypothetical protein
VLQEIAWRLDNRSHTSFTAMGRTWSSVKLTMSEMTNYKAISATFAANIGTNATTVFDTKWDWPTQSGRPLLTPDVWGGLQGKIRFPFNKPWVYSGKNATLADYTFDKGTLANGVAWSSIRAAYFYLDGEYINTFQTAGTIERIPAVPPICNDSAITFAAGAYTYGYAYAYGKSGATITLRNKLVFSHYSYYTAPGAPVIQALGLGGNRTGVNIGAGCNPLYVDLSKPAVLMTFQTLPPYGYSGLMGWAVPWQSALAGRELWLQGAWQDSTTKAFSLTSATRITLPTRLPPDALTGLKGVYDYRGVTNATGFVLVTGSPYTRYTVK